MCILCVHVKINKRLFEPFCVWIMLERRFPEKQATTSDVTMTAGLAEDGEAVRAVDAGRVHETTLHEKWWRQYSELCFLLQCVHLNIL